MRHTVKATAFALAFAIALAGCIQHVPKEALELTSESLADRQLQSRRFLTANEKTILASSAAVLQDLGFTIDSSATELGLVVASKDLSAVEPVQVTGSLLLFAATAAIGAPVLIPWDAKQKVRVSLTSRRSESNRDEMLVRVTFQRIVWNTQQRISKTELLNEAKLYQDFFEKLSKAVFLDAHEL
jgi:hypothetical protein